VLDILKSGDGGVAPEQFSPPARCIDDWRAFTGLFGQLHRRVHGWPAELSAVRQWYQPHLERVHEDAGIRSADLDQLEEIASAYPSRERFLTELTLDPPDAVSNEAGAPLLDEDYLILSTIHSAKGQEWKSVFVLNCVDGCIPSDLGVGTSEEIEEERRLLYVAMTRARDQLDIVVPQRFYTHQQARNGDRHVYAGRSRFLPQQIMPVFEARAWPSIRPQAQGAAARSQAPIDVGARMRAMWKRA
jgi:DNA helicase-2/ATP-dependent DNA helicase PcrA